MKLYTKRTFLASIMFVLVAFSFATSFCSSSSSEPQQDSWSKRVGAGILAGIVKGVKEGPGQGLIIGALGAYFRAQSNDFWLEAALGGICLTIAEMVAGAVQGAIIGGALGLQEKTIEATQEKTESIMQKHLYENGIVALIRCILLDRFFVESMIKKGLKLAACQTA